MKLGRLGLRGIADGVVLVARLRRPQNELGGALFYSTSSSTTTARNRKPWWSEVPPEASHQVSLYQRLSRVPVNVSVVPVLDQWIDEGQSVDENQLRLITKKLRRYGKCSHALEVSMWMSDKRYFPLTRGEIAIRLDLISKVYGVEEAEKYFNTVPKKMRLLEVYSALLNCYAQDKSVEKAEAVFQAMKDLEKGPFTYSVMLNLYHQTGNTKKFDALLREMGENGVRFNRFTYTILLNAHAAVSDVEGIEKILIRMKADTKYVLDWSMYCALADAYAKVGLPDKALEMAKISETLIAGRSWKMKAAYVYLIPRYAAIGEKNEVLRLWRVHKEKEKVWNHGYKVVIASVLKFEDFEAAEEIFDDWESQNLTYDMRIPNLLIRAYCRKSMLKKAENLVNRVTSKGGEPDAVTWQYFATAYVEKNQPSMAVEMMKKSVLDCRSWFKPCNKTLAACLAFLKREGDPGKMEEFIQLLGDNGIIRVDAQLRLLNHMKDGNSDEGATVTLLDDSLTGGE